MTPSTEPREGNEPVPEYPASRVTLPSGKSYIHDPLPREGSALEIDHSGLGAAYLRSHRDVPIVHRDDEPCAKCDTEPREGSEPLTEAGRFLLAWDHNGAPMPAGVFRDRILAIEREAAARGTDRDAMTREGRPLPTSAVEWMAAHPTPREGSEPLTAEDIIRAAWAFLDPITQQDYDGEKVDVESDDLDRFRGILRRWDRERAARSEASHPSVPEDHGDPDHPMKEWSRGWHDAFDAVRSGDADARQAVGWPSHPSVPGLREQLEIVADALDNAAEDAHAGWAYYGDAPGPESPHSGPDDFNACEDSQCRRRQRYVEDARAALTREVAEPSGHPFHDEWRFQRSMAKGNPKAGKPIHPDQPCFDCGVPYGHHPEVAEPSGVSLDVRRVVQAIANIAKRHGVVKDPPEPLSLMRIYGYSKATPDMDAEIAAEYTRLAQTQEGSE